MKLDDLVKTMIVPAVFAANTAYATEAKVATPEQIANVIQTNDSTDILVSQNNVDDWHQQRNLIDNNQATVLIQPVQDKPGYCEVGLDGFPQKYDPPADKRTKDGKLEKSEMILNLSEPHRAKQFYFPCDLKAETPKPNVPNGVVIPQKTEEKDLPSLTFSPGAGYLQIFTAADEKYNFAGDLYGGSLFLNVQPSFTNWYWGGRFLGYGNVSSATENIEVPAAEGPLDGQLVMRGVNDYSLESLGIGIGSTFGYMIPLGEKGLFGIGLELENGIMHDWVTRELTENSAHYINNNIVEGTNISNPSDNTETSFYGYGMGGLRIKLPYACLNISGGIRTNNLNNVYGMFGVGAAYCPNKE